LAYAGFEVEGAERVHEELLKLVRDMVKPIDVNESRRELEEVLRSLSKWSPRELRLGSELPKIEVRLSRASALIIVLPPRHVLKAVEASKDVGHCLEWAEGAGKYPVLVYYSRRGQMTTTAYLYLGNVMEDNNVGGCSSSTGRRARWRRSWRSWRARASTCPLRTRLSSSGSDQLLGQGPGGEDPYPVIDEDPLHLHRRPYSLLGPEREPGHLKSCLVAY